MEIIYLLIPIVICTIIGILYRERSNVVWTTIISISICGLILLVTSQIMRYSNFTDTEYLSYYYTKIRHEDPWNERVRHTRQVRIGKHTHTQVYYTTRHHGDKWYKYSNDGNRKSINKEEYDELRKMWATPERFVDMHRHYYTIDGDAQEYDFCNHWECLRGFTGEYSYENRISGSGSVLRYRDISKEEAKDLKLKDYTSSKCIYDIPVTSEERQKIDFINCFYGKKKEIHLFILGFPASQGVRIAEDQRAYWQGGNKNELVICIGLEPGSRIIKWVDCFSWQDDITLDCKIKSYLMKERQLDLVKLGDFIESNLNLWHRKSFKDYEYIQTYLTDTQMMILLWIMVGVSVVAGIVQIIYLNDQY